MDRATPPLSRRGRRIPPPAWACGERSCPKYRWQPLSVIGECDELAEARADLAAHYRRSHPELEPEEVSPDARLCAA